MTKKAKSVLIAKEFTKAPPPESLPEHLMYVRIEAVIPIDREDESGAREMIEESINCAVDALCNYGCGVVTECYEVTDEFADGCETLKLRMNNGDTSGEQ